MSHVLRLFLCGLLLSTQIPASLAASDDSAAIDSAAAYLVAAWSPQGQFRYQHDFLSGQDSNRNNLVRQAGAAFALGEYLLYEKASVERRSGVANTLRQVLMRFHKDSIEWGGGQLLTFNGDPDQAKSGATALALVAGLFYRRATGDESVGDWLEAWLQGLLSQQDSDGNFRSLPRRRGHSPYANGEIWLALAHYQKDFSSDRRVQLALQRATDRFIEQYGGNPEVGFFHWGVMAASQLFSQGGDRRLRDFVRSQVNHYLDVMRPRVSADGNSCYAVEGLANARRLLVSTAGSRELDRLDRRIEAEMRKNLALQIRPGQQRIDLGKGRYLAVPELADYAGAFLDGRWRPQARIDSTQHCLSALLKVATD